jgi:TetR/AcrR family transcriptional regulator
MPQISNPTGDHHAKPKSPHLDMVKKAGRDPERTRQKILEAAIIEFSEKGLTGARIDGIARRAGANYQALYYHFGNKEMLYAAALEAVITLGGRLSRFPIPIQEIGPIAALSQLIDHLFDAFGENIAYINLLADENMHQARHFDQMPATKRLLREVLDTTEVILRLGKDQGVFRADLDPILAYMTIAGLISSYISNVPMNSKVFGRQFSSPDEIALWRAHLKTIVISGFSRPEALIGT